MTNGIKDLRVLVVDDSQETLNLIKLMLTELEVEQIFMAKDGKEALEFLDMCDDLVDIILCDWNMPKLSGLELLRQIRSVDPGFPFLMITGAADMSSVVEAKASGVTGYIVKPFSRSVLEKKLSIVQRMLRHRSDAA